MISASVSLGYLASIFFSRSFCAGHALYLDLRLLFQQVRVLLDRRSLIGIEGLVADLLQPCLYGLCRDLLLIALALDDLGQQSILAAVLLAHLVEPLLQRGQLVVERFEGGAFGNEVAGNQNRRGNEVRLEAPLAFQVIVRLRPDELLVLVFDLNDLARLRALDPAVGGDQVGVRPAWSRPSSPSGAGRRRRHRAAVTGGTRPGDPWR